MKLALFDLDGTITRGDTFIAFIRYNVGWGAFLFGMMLMSPVIACMKLGLIPNWRAKEIVWSFFFKGRSTVSVKHKGDAFIGKVLPGMIRPQAADKLDWHKKNGHTVAIVTASGGLWLGNWATQQGFHFIGTRFEEKDDRLTGRIQGKNCHGEEKVVRIREVFDLSDYEYIYAYGDSEADKPMMSLAQESFFKPFRAAYDT